MFQIGELRFTDYNHKPRVDFVLQEGFRISVIGVTFVHCPSYGLWSTNKHGLNTKILEGFSSDTYIIRKRDIDPVAS